MTNPAAARHVEIDNIHSAAICREIGQRLGLYFKKELLEEPPELKRLLARLPQLDKQDEL